MKVGTTDQSTVSNDDGLIAEIYEMALIDGKHENLIDPKGNKIDWLLDLRLPLLDGRIACRLGKLVADRVRSAGYRQVAGYGFGGTAMVCAALNVEGHPPLQGGFVRPCRKPHGRQRLVEGPLEIHDPIVLLDDLLNSGNTALQAISQLQHEGFHVAGYFSIFEYNWGQGRKKIEQEGLWVDAMMELTISQSHSVSSDSV